MQIDFDALPQRIEKFEQPLKRIIKGETSSHYRQVAKDAYESSGRRAATTAGLWSRFESLQVIAIMIRA
jgi:hypothetical protein